MLSTSFASTSMARPAQTRQTQSPVSGPTRHSATDSVSFAGNERAQKEKSGKKPHSSSPLFSGRTVEQKVDALPTEDKKNLIRFWRGLLTDPNGSMAFTLFKDKPVTQNEGAISPDLMEGENSPVSTWKRLSQYFPSKNFHLTIKERNIYDPRLQEFVMFNKAEVKKIIRENKDDLYVVTGSGSSNDILNFLQARTEAQGFEGLNESVDNDDALTGRLMGFCKSDIDNYGNTQLPQVNSQHYMPLRNHKNPVRYPEYITALSEPESQRKFYDILRQRDEIEADLNPDDCSIKSTDTRFLKKVLKKWTS